MFDLTIKNNHFHLTTTQNIVKGNCTPIELDTNGNCFCLLDSKYDIFSILKFEKRHYQYPWNNKEFTHFYIKNEKGQILHTMDTDEKITARF